MARLPEELIEYLTTLVGTPSRPALYWERVYDEYLEDMEDNSVPGLVVHGTPTKEQVAELERVLMPGAHLLLVAPEEEPTGDTGACRLEDGGFEIRDTILLAQEAGAIHYVPKAARREREAGCWGLPARKGSEAVDREEGTDGLNSPRAGAGRTAALVRNFHPTVKPVAVMQRLLEDVDEDAVVWDPFMGSGTTGIACIKTGHSFVGIEMDEDYLRIADARVRHWASVYRGRAEVESDIEGDGVVRIKEKPKGGIIDLFWEEEDEP